MLPSSKVVRVTLSLFLIPDSMVTIFYFLVNCTFILSEGRRTPVHGHQLDIRNVGNVSFGLSWSHV